MVQITNGLGTISTRKLFGEANNCNWIVLDQLTGYKNFLHYPHCRQFIKGDKFRPGAFHISLESWHTSHGNKNPIQSITNRHPLQQQQYHCISSLQTTCKLQANETKNAILIFHAPTTKRKARGRDRDGLVSSILMRPPASCNHVKLVFSDYSVVPLILITRPNAFLGPDTRGRGKI